MKIACQREFEVREPDGAEKALLLRISEPAEDTQEGGDWACTFALTGEGIEVSRTMYGVDALQALLHAIQGAKAHLLLLQRTRQLEIKWLGMAEWGLPEMP